MFGAPNHVFELRFYTIAEEELMVELWEELWLIKQHCQDGA